METLNPNFGTMKRFRIHWHGYECLSDPNVQKGDDTYCGKSWVDAVNQFLDSRFTHGPRYFFIDYYEEWDLDKEEDDNA